MRVKNAFRISRLRGGACSRLRTGLSRLRHAATSRTCDNKRRPHAWHLRHLRDGPLNCHNCLLRPLSRETVEYDHTIITTGVLTVLTSFPRSVAVYRRGSIPCPRRSLLRVGIVLAPSNRHQGQSKTRSRTKSLFLPSAEARLSPRQRPLALSRPWSVVARSASGDRVSKRSAGHTVRPGVTQVGVWTPA